MSEIWHIRKLQTGDYLMTRLSTMGVSVAFEILVKIYKHFFLSVLKNINIYFNHKLTSNTIFTGF